MLTNNMKKQTTRISFRKIRFLEHPEKCSSCEHKLIMAVHEIITPMAKIKGFEERDPLIDKNNFRFCPNCGTMSNYDELYYERSCDEVRGAWIRKQEEEKEQ